MLGLLSEGYSRANAPLQAGGPGLYPLPQQLSYFREKAGVWDRDIKCLILTWSLYLLFELRYGWRCLIFSIINPFFSRGCNSPNKKNGFRQTLALSLGGLLFFQVWKWKSIKLCLNYRSVNVKKKNQPKKWLFSYKSLTVWAQNFFLNGDFANSLWLTASLLLPEKIW